MFISKVVLHNFRCHTQTTIEFSTQMNSIYGKNGSGKTSILEGLNLLSTGRSFLAPQNKDMIQHGADNFYVKIEFTCDDTNQTISIGYNQKEKRISHNENHFNRFSSVVGIIPSVLLAPKDSMLISGSPQERRRFLNVQLAQIDPSYIHHLLRYHTALKHRNALLKIKGEQMLDTWEHIMAESYMYLLDKRENLINLLSPKVNSIAKKFSSDKDNFELIYQPSIKSKDIDEMKQVFKKSRIREMAMGTSLNGAHRDDFIINHNLNTAKSFVSQGQSKTCISALKIAQWEHLKEKTGKIPIMLIDDFGVHLDTCRKSLFHDYLKELGQVIITSPNKQPNALTIELL